MKVLLVVPPELRQGPYFDIPTNILYLLSALKTVGIECAFVDGNIVGMEGIIAALDKFHPEIVGVSSMVPARFHALDVARHAKEHGARTVIGNHYAQWLWSQVMTYPYVDACAFGEGERTIVSLAQQDDWSTIPGLALRHADGTVYRTPSTAPIAILDDIAFPAWSEVNWALYRQHSALGPRLFYSRGCMNHCRFCQSRGFWHGYRHRGPQNVLDELQILADLDQRDIILGDDAIAPEPAMELFDAIARAKPQLGMMQFNVTTRSDGITKELCQRMQVSGVYEVCLGIESGSQCVLNHMDKGITVEQNRQAIRMLKEAGIRVKALMIFHSIGETPEDLALSYQFLNETKPDSIGTIDCLWLFPGTRYYEEAKRGKYDYLIHSGRDLVTDAFWRDPAYTDCVIAWRDGYVFSTRVVS